MAVFNTDFYTHIDVKKFYGHKDEVNCVAFSPDFEILVTGSDDERTRVFNTRTGTMVVRLKGQEGAIRCVDVSPDSQYIASGSYDKSVMIYRTCNAETIHKLTSHLKSVESVTFSPCSTLLCSTSWDRTGILWQVETGYMLRLFQGHTSLVQCAAFSPCQRMVATGSWDHTVRVWSLKRTAGGEHLHELSAHKSNVHAVAFSRHNILATGSWDKKVILWNPYKGEILYTLIGHEGWVQALCFSADGYLLVTNADDEMVKVWNVHTGSCLKTMDAQTDTASHCGFHPSGALVATGSAATTLALVSDTSAAETGDQPPHELKGEEILDKPASQRRAQSARPAHSQRSCDGNQHSRGRPKTAALGTPSVATLSVSHVEQWLASSYKHFGI